MAQGRNSARLLKLVRLRPPKAARIANISFARSFLPRYSEFTIRPSSTGEGPGVDVTPDIATCQECAADISQPNNRRFGYAFTNCTECGPRYSIVEGIPYDRERTTMRSFTMCDECRREYNNPDDRRFHAQPNACPVCGPSLTLLDRRGQPVNRDPLPEAARAILSGRVVALKSIGGFQLCCNASDDRAVGRLRRLKGRRHKPLALMCDTVETARKLCRVSKAAARLLRSSAAPVVLMPKLASPKLRVSTLIAPSNHYLGIMLPYSPLHKLLFSQIKLISGSPCILVATSANPKDEPIHVTEHGLFSTPSTRPDCCLSHNRPIANPCDDSVVSCPGRTAVVVRRSRGYVPQPLRLASTFHVEHPVLAVGGDMKNSFCLAAGDRAFLSPHIGTLSSSRALDFFAQALRRYENWTGIRPRIIACDLHPDYESTRLAERLAHERALPLVRVQHHAAHIAAAVAENGLAEPVLGIACDGTGFGTDQAIWGCELILLNPDMSWFRLAHLGYLRLPAMLDAVPSPVRVADHYLRQALHPSKAAGGVASSSLGRLFDAVAAITGVCRQATFDGHAAIALEAAAATAKGKVRPSGFDVHELILLSSRPAVILPGPLLLHVSRETRAGTSAAAVAAWFHDVVSRALAAAARMLCRQHGVRTVCLCGGSFQNTILRESVVSLLRHSGLRPVVGSRVPVNDGGLSFGQAVMAASRLLPS